MSARDELAALIRENRAPWVTNSEHRQMEEAQADAIAAAGFRKVNNLDISAVERVANVLVEAGAFGVPWEDASEEDRAEAINRAHVLLDEAAGQAMPRMITTAEELADAHMVVVRTAAGTIANLVNGRAYCFGYEASAPAATLALPVTVLWEREGEQ